MKVLLEIRAGEGGEDARDLVGVMGSVYAKFARNIGCSLDIEDRGHL